jgi:hypothetical protein
MQSGEKYMVLKRGEKPPDMGGSMPALAGMQTIPGNIGRSQSTQSSQPTEMIFNQNGDINNGMDVEQLRVQVLRWVRKDMKR